MRGIPRSAVLLLSLAVFLCVAAPFWSWIPDDAYISFEYARNLAEGNGLVFNPGERVEGFSNPLWTLLLALVARLGGSIELVARILSLAGGLTALWLITLLIRSSVDSTVPGIGRPTRWMLSLTAASFFPLAFYSTSGLETTFYLCCLLIGVTFHLTAVIRRVQWPDVVSLFAFLAASLSRPEGIAFLAVAAGIGLISRRRGSGRLAIVCAVVAVVYLGVAVLKYQYYGSVVPNTFFAKPGASIDYTQPLARGARYLIRFFGASGTALLIPFALIPPRTRSGWHTWLYLWCFAICQLAFIIFAGADVLRFDRFAVPLFPWLLALAAMGASRFASSTTVRAGFVAALAVVVGLSGFRAYLAHSKYCEHDWMHAHAQRQIGQFLARYGLNTGGPDFIVANEIGAIRYHSRRPVIDMLGLTDDAVAAVRYRSFQTYGIGSSPWSAVTVSRYLLDRNPTLVLLPSTKPLSLDDRTRHRDDMHPLWYAILTEPRLQSGYHASCWFKIHERKYLYVFERNDISKAGGRPALPKGRCLDGRWISGP